MERLRRTPALSVADQALASGTNFLAVIMVARSGSTETFGVFSIFLIVFYLFAGFNRAVPHALAMTLEWDDERARNAYFFLPALVLGIAGTLVLVPVFWVMDSSFKFLPGLFIALLVQDAVRTHAFAVQRPFVAVASDLVWLIVASVGFLFVSTAASAATVWALGALCGAVVARPWRRIRWQRRSVGGSASSAALEYLTLSGLNFVSPLLAGPLVSIRGVAALQGVGLLRGPVGLVVQGLVLHRMAGPAIAPDACLREALRLASRAFIVTLVYIPPLLLLKDHYGPRLLGSTWPVTEPLLYPTVLVLLLGSICFGPATVARKMGLFKLSARVQMSLAPCFLAFSLVGSALWGTKGYLYGTACAYVLYAMTWWIVLPKATRHPSADLTPARPPRPSIPG